jgi:DNA-binding response OmpR family regulator
MKVAVLEDDEAQAQLIVRTLATAGHACVIFTTGRALLAKLRSETFDLLMLDWNLPDMQGIEIAAWARAHITPTPPIVMVTARSDAEDIVEGLNTGADDFLVKPIMASVLLARVHAVLRRAYPADPGSRVETFGPVAFDPLNLAVNLGDGAMMQLTTKEFTLALLFFRNLHRALSRAYLLETIWGRNPDLATRTLDAHVSRIRSKLRLRPDNGFKLAPVYSYGYRLERVTEDQAEAGA